MVKIELSEKSNTKNIPYLIEELKRYDNKEGYKRSYETVKKKLESTIKQLIEKGEKCLEHIHPLLEHEETWSCTFALEIIKEIKSEKSISILINFIKNNENGDYWESCDDALWALQAIGEPAVKPLLNEIKSNFQEEIYYGYLVEALTGIKHDDVYSFMLEVLKDYLENTEKYDEWFEIDNFTYNFEVQGKKEVLPLLKRLAAMEHLFDKETEEMAKKFKKYEDLKKQDINEKELLEHAVDLEEKKDYENALDCITKILAVYTKSYHALFLDARINRKLGKPKLLILSEALDEAKKQKASQDINLITIYEHRYKYYKIEEAKKEVIDCCKKLRELYDSGDYSNATIANKLSIIEFIREKEMKFGLSKNVKKISKEDIGKIIKKTSTLDIDSIAFNINKNMIKSENEIKNLLEQNQGVLVDEYYLAFDKKTNESNRIQSSYLMPIDTSKVCICGSGEYLKKCCLDKVKNKSIFTANTDYENYSVLEEIKKEINTNESYLELAKKFKEDSRFYCEEKDRNNSMFLYHGPHIFTQELGTVIFGTITIKRSFFNNKGKIIIEAVSKNRFDVINSAVEDNLGE